jgi:hypothetical protein
MGSLWNDTDGEGGYYGPWAKQSSDNMRACLYCHGNVNRSETSVNSLSSLIHNESSLGRVQAIFLSDPANIVNASGLTAGDTKTYWCSTCHSPYNTSLDSGNPNWTAINATFNKTDWELPIINLNQTRGNKSHPDYRNASDGTTVYINHKFNIAQDHSDQRCEDCHGGNLSRGDSSGLDEFMHNVAVGVGAIDPGPNCGDASCHPTGELGATQINFTSVERGVHAGLNKDAVNTSSLDRPVAKACWACHNYNGDEPSEGQHPPTQIRDNPYECPDCHVPGGVGFGNYTAPNVTAHVPNDVTFYNANLTTNASYAFCTNCHDEDIGDTNGSGSGFAGRSLLANVSHYAHSLKSNRLFNNGTGNSSRCRYCHYNDSQSEREAWGNATDPRVTAGHNSSWNETDCGSCHFSSLAPNLHATGLNGSPSGGPRCDDCHNNDTGIASSAPKVNTTAMRRESPHWSINNGTGQYNNSRMCWACHANGSEPATGQGHPTNYQNPFYCTSCHDYSRVNQSDPGKSSENYSAPIVRSHTPNGSWLADNDDSARITNTDTTCESCHNNSLASGTAGSGTDLFEASHYLTSNVSNFELLNTSKCEECHFKTDNDQYGNATKPDQLYSSTMNTNNDIRLLPVPCGVELVRPIWSQHWTDTPEVLPRCPRKQ